MIKFLSIASGSNGNCYFFTNGITSFLIDAGVGPRSVKKALESHNLSLESIDFILITHDHIDHIKALGILSKKYHKPIYTTKILRGALLHHSITHNYVKGNIQSLDILTTNNICGVKVVPFPVPHDATETVGYYIEFDNKKIVIVTDCGEVTENVIKFSKKADILIFETNYDDEMLISGSYSESLKARISESHHGHLSNLNASEALKKIYLEKEGELSHIFLCHLSANNNTPELALASVNNALKSVGATSSEILIVALLRGVPSNLYSF